MPFVNRDKLNGGAVWYDAHMINSERLLLAFLHSATERGLAAANYARAESLLISQGRVHGAVIHDRIADRRFEVRARLTVNAAGPWINELLGAAGSRETPVAFSTAVNLVLKRRFCNDYAFAAPTARQYRDRDALINRGSRLLFFVPWRGLTLAGTAHRPYRGDAGAYRVSEQEIEEFLAEINGALPGADVRREEVVHVYAGLLPMASVNDAGDVTLVKHYRIIDHSRRDGLEGLLSLLTVKYTTARGVAEAVIQEAMKKLGRRVRSTESRRLPLWGGDVGRFSAFFEEKDRALSGKLPALSRLHLLETYGSQAETVLREAPEPYETIAEDSPVLKAEILFALRREMALKLSDLMLRRTELGSGGRPPDAHIQAVADIAATELGWSDEKKEREIQEYLLYYQPVQKEEK